MEGVIVALKDFAAENGGTAALLLACLLTLIQIAPIKINPWSALARALGRAINRDVLRELSQVRVEQMATRERLDEHIKTDDERAADLHRTRILQFNTELLRNIQHTKEEYNEVLYNIDSYEQYCREHPDYSNNRSVHAISNINRVYAERLKKHDFL